MATTTANKHGLRAAATERRNRHAQRTPLPPKPGVVEAAREEIDGPALDPETLTLEEERKAALVDAAQSDDRSHSKAHAFAEKAVAAKWQVSVDASTHGVELTATRGAETIVQAWSNGVWQYDASFYGHGDRTTKPRHASGARGPTTPAEIASMAARTRRVTRSTTAASPAAAFRSISATSRRATSAAPASAATR